LKTAVITGASRGIGAAVAMKLAEKGYFVAVNFCSSKEAAREVVENIINAGGKAQAFCADVRDASQVEAMIKQVLEISGEINILVNNAGVSAYGLLQDMTEEIYDNIFDINMKGVFFCTKAVLPIMIKQKNGSVINISSMWGIAGASCESLYSASKAALIGFTKALAKEAGPSGIRANCIAPGLIETEMNACLSEETKQQLINETPIERIGTAEDIANAVCFLADDKQAGFITGQVLSVDGGYII